MAKLLVDLRIIAAFICGLRKNKSREVFDLTIEGLPRYDIDEGQ